MLGQRDRPAARRAGADHLRRPAGRRAPQAAGAQLHRAARVVAIVLCVAMWSLRPPHGTAAMHADDAAHPAARRLVQHPRVRGRRRPPRPRTGRAGAARDRRRRHRPAGGRRAPRHHAHRRCRCNTWPTTLRLHAVAGPTLQRGSGHYGNALLTRRPVLDVRHVDLTVYRREPRGAIDADLDVDGAVVRVIVTHLGLLPGERRTQVRRLLDVLGRNRSDAVDPARRHQRMVRGRPAAALAARAPGPHGGRGHLPGRAARVRAGSHLGPPAPGVAVRDRARHPDRAHRLRSPARDGGRGIREEVASRRMLRAVALVAAVTILSPATSARAQEAGRVVRPRQGPALRRQRGDHDGRLRRGVLKTDDRAYAPGGGDPVRPHARASRKRCGTRSATATPPGAISRGTCSAPQPAC